MYDAVQIMHIFYYLHRPRKSVSQYHVLCMEKTNLNAGERKDIATRETVSQGKRTFAGIYEKRNCLLL